MFCPIIMACFFHELTIHRGEGTFKEVIKCYFQSCFDSCRCAQNTPEQVKNKFWGSKIILKHSNKNMIYEKA